VVAKVEPEYPHLARSMNLTCVVKLEVVVGGNGSVKVVQIRGGHPVLAEAAVAAVSRWRWERTSEETRELIQINFNPQ
jgi:TonB family protein